MASENLAKLQATTNRFASEAGFSPLVIDGGMGPKTIAAIRAAISDAVSSVSDLISQEARQWDSALNSASGDDIRATVIMQQLGTLNTLLTRAADLAGYPGAAVVASKPSVPSASLTTTTPDRSAFTVKPPANANVLDKARLWFRQQTVPVKAAVGIGAGIAAFSLFGVFTKKKSKAGVAGRW